MLEILTGIIVELTVQAITKSAGSVARAAGILKPPKAPDWLVSPLTPSVSALVVSMLAELAGSAVPETALTRAAESLRSVEAVQLQRSVTIDAIIQPPGWQSAIHEPLLSVLIYIGGCQRQDAERIAQALAGVLATAATTGLEQFQAASGRYYGILRQLAWQEKLAGYVEGIQKNMLLLRPRLDAEQLADVDRFVQSYAQEMTARTADLVPQHFDTQVRVPIDQLYVAPRFVSRGEEVQRASPMSKTADPLQEEISFSLDHAMRRMYRTVILGSPGAGKTTLTQKLMHDLCGRQARRACLPFLVSLHRYEQHAGQRDLSFVAYLSEYVGGSLQIAVSPQIIDYLLQTGRALVIFDGIDELLNIDRRKEMVESILSFARQYPDTSIVATSRIIGYEMAPLDSRIFAHLHLEHFDDGAVASYAHNWFRLSKVNPDEQALMAAKFLAESESVRDLRCNPLLLSLMCNLYRTAGYIPANRADVYEQCALMLFNKWDELRGIRTHGSPQADASYARWALQDVAYWALTEPALASGIPRGPLRDKMAVFLREARYGSQAAAEAAADDLLSLWRGRAWILTDMGSDELHPVYQFTHRTFLEYFAATHITRNSRSAAELWSRLRAGTISGEWDMVTQISMQAYHLRVVHGADEICALILEEVERRELGAIEALRFVCRHLDALAPTPDMIELLVIASVQLALTALPAFRRQPSWDDYEQSRDRQIPAAHLSGPDQLAYEADPAEWEASRGVVRHNARQVIEPVAMIFGNPEVISGQALGYLRQFCQREAEGSDRSVAARALLVLLSEREFLYSARLMTAETADDAPEQPGPGSSLLSERSGWVRRRMADLAAENFWLPIVAARAGAGPVTEALRAGSLPALFNAESPFDIAADRRQECFAESAIGRYVRGAAPPEDLAVLAAAGRAIRDDFQCRQALPELDLLWFSGSQAGEEIIAGTFLDAPGEPGPAPELGAAETDADVLLGAAVLLATFCEAERWVLLDLSDDQLADLRLGPAQALEGLFYWHYTGKDTHWSQSPPLVGADLEIVSLWARRDAHFVIRPAG